MKTYFTIIFALFLFINVQAQDEITLDYYLPDEVEYSSEIPTPKEVFNFEVGEWHARHDEIVTYMYALAEASDRVTVVETARSHENRPLLSVVFTSPDNHDRLEEIRLNHLALGDADNSDNLDVSNMPVIVQLGYSVHGNESSAANAAIVAAYHLAAAEGEEIENVLANSVIMIDPTLNPDGHARFAQWANSHKSLKTLVTDPETREYDEMWPGGRTNHYWFDLNRDWMLVQHPESEGRVKRYQDWKPNIVIDVHEMGSNATYFFQPGIPSRTNPLTPQRNQALTASIAEYHAEELDKIQSLYYTKESFDDFYYGKGSTYPDIQGSIGILFEQASSRGHAQETIHGVLTFPFTILNQFRATLSTIESSIDLRVELLEHYRLFYKEAAREASRSTIKAYVFGESADQARTYHLAELINHHNIEVYELNESITANGENFVAGKAYIIPTDQPQYKFITALFERRTTFTDSLFYDVSTWTMPYAFNLPFAELNNRAYNDDLLGEKFDGTMSSQGEIVGGRSNYAYAFEWDEYYAPRALYRLLEAGVKAKVAKLPFSGVTSIGEHNFDFGTILVPLGIQDDKMKVQEIVEQIALEDNIQVFPLNTGLSTGGIDLGSNNFSMIEKPSVAVIAGEGTNAYEIGEMWHLMDYRYHMPLSIIDKKDLPGADLDRYTVLIMTGYNYNDLSSNTVEGIKDWVREGGVLLAIKQGVQWAARQELADVEYVSREDEQNGDSETRPYINRSADVGAQVIGGSIFNAKLDLTHPLGYGYNDSDITVFRNSTIFMEKGENPYSTPLYYSDNPLASGYISDENEETIAGTAAIVVSRFGGGKVIAMTDNPNFRAFWFGTNKLFANSIFFGPNIRSNTAN
jgi:hypothetical protein